MIKTKVTLRIVRRLSKKFTIQVLHFDTRTLNITVKIMNLSQLIILKMATRASPLVRFVTSHNIN